MKGPLAETLKKIYVCGHLDGHHQPGCDRRIVAGLARRAYRRPVAAEEVGRAMVAAGGTGAACCEYDAIRELARALPT